MFRGGISQGSVIMLDVLLHEHPWRCQPMEGHARALTGQTRQDHLRDAKSISCLDTI